MAINSSNESSSKWYKIMSFYPEALSHTHTVPPVHFNRVPYALDTVPGTSVLALRTSSSGFVQSPPAKRVRKCPADSESVIFSPPFPPPQSLWALEQQHEPESVQDSDIRDDVAHARVLRNLEDLGRHRQEVMFILSQFNVQSYLNKREYRNVVSQLPHPSRLNKPGMLFSRGEFDVLVIHRRHGILLGEVKSVGHNHANLQLTEAESDASVTKRVAKSLKQLARMETVVRHMVSDVTPHLIVRTTLFLPSVSRAQLCRILGANPQLEQDICGTLGAATGAQAAQLCCCSDDLSAPDTWWDVSPAVLSKLTSWWCSRMDTKDPAVTDNVYLDIVARFVGPASSVRVYSPFSPRVEVRTEGQAVAELGFRLSQLVLTPRQWDLRCQQLPLVYLTGPPGTGKTLMLVMEGVSCLLNNMDTFVVSTSANNFAVSALIAEQLKKTAIHDPKSPTPIDRLHLRHYDFINDDTGLDTAVSELTTLAQGGACIIMDETIFDTREDLGQRTYSLVRQLIDQVPGLHLWCAGLFHYAPPPPGLQVEVLTVPLRSAPAVLREVRPAVDRLTHIVHNYSDSGIPAPGDGQRVRRLRHEGGSHTGRWPVDCTQCGRNLATELRRLGVGDPGSGVTFRDVFILTRSSLWDEVLDTTPACGVVHGIREKVMPVCVLGGKADRQRMMRDTATAATDCITVANWRAVLGLERKVVVWLPGRMPVNDDHRSDQDIDDEDRLMLVTRCTTQLIVVDVPPYSHSHSK